MEHEKNNDRLEEIFAQKLDKASSEPNLWSTPNEKVWLGVNTELREQRRARRLLILFLFLFGLMLVFFLFGNQFLEYFWKEEAVEVPVASTGTSSQPETIVETLMDKDKVEEKLEESVRPKENLVSKEHHSGNDLPPNIPAQIISESFEQKNKSIASISDIGKQEADNELIKLKESKGFESNTTVGNAPSGEIDLRTSLVEALNPITSEPITLLEERAYTTPFDDKISKRKDAWIIETSAGTYSSLRGYPISTEELNLEITPTHTYAATINVEKIVNKNWSIGLGIGYSKAAFDANYDLNFAYSKANERETQDGFEKAYQHTLPSLLSPLDAEFVLVRSTTISEGEDIPLSLRLSHGTQQLSVPIYAKYRVHRGNWSYYLKAGIAGNMLLSNLSTDHITTESHHDAIHARSSSFEIPINSNPIQQNDFSLSFLTSIGAQLHLRNNIYLLFEPTFSGEIIATYPNAATGDKIINLGGQIGAGVLLD